MATNKPAKKPAKKTSKKPKMTPEQSVHAVNKLRPSYWLTKAVLGEPGKKKAPPKAKAKTKKKKK